jgi:hypothetical protein
MNKPKNMKEEYELFSRGIINPNIGACYQTGYYHEKQETWAEKRRDELLRKLIRKRVFWNDVLLFIMKIIASAIIVTTISFIVAIIAVYLISDDFRFEFSIIIGLLAGVLSAVLIIIVSDMIHEEFSITYVKHKNKYYSLDWY